MRKLFVFFVCFSVDAVVERYKHEHIVEGLSLREPVSRVTEIVFYVFKITRGPFLETPGNFPRPKTILGAQYSSVAIQFFFKLNAKF